ncbi:MAG TPA: hypothetical protein VF766_02020, partial [Pyrinomonadaceae bacterium]
LPLSLYRTPTKQAIRSKRPTATPSSGLSPDDKRSSVGGAEACVPARIIYRGKQLTGFSAPELQRIF